MSFFVALLSGLIFGLGLIAAGMTDPSKVQGFLDITGAWDPSLALVMGGAIAVAVLAFWLARRRHAAGLLSLTGEHIEIPNSTVIDRRLLVGGLLFGAGWGLGGFCPGPALVALGAGLPGAAAFVLSMLVGMWLHDRYLAPRLAARSAAAMAPKAPLPSVRPQAQLGTESAR